MNFYKDNFGIEEGGKLSKYGILHSLCLLVIVSLLRDFYDDRDCY
jgi:hypothetical protein